MLEKAFKLFAEYAQRVERDTKGTCVFSLRIFDDQSGNIEDLASQKAVLSFRNFEDLAQQLEQKKQGETNAANN